MVLVKINTSVHYHVKKIEFVKTKSVKDQFHFLMVVSAGMAHLTLLDGTYTVYLFQFLICSLFEMTTTFKMLRIRNPVK